MLTLSRLRHWGRKNSGLHLGRAKNCTDPFFIQDIQKRDEKTSEFSYTKEKSIGPWWETMHVPDSFTIETAKLAFFFGRQTFDHSADFFHRIVDIASSRSPSYAEAYRPQSRVVWYAASQQDWRRTVKEKIFILKSLSLCLHNWPTKNLIRSKVLLILNK